jgi:adenylate cyclase
MKKQLFILVLFNLILSSSFSQNKKIDSLNEALKKTAEDTSRVNIFNEFYKEYQSTDPELSLKYAFRALALAEKISFKKGMGSSLNNIGFYYYNQDSSSKALVFFFKANDIFTQIEYNRGKAIVLANIGNTFYSLRSYSKALEYYSGSLAAAKEIGDSSRVAKLLGNIGIVYYDQGYYSKALDVYLKSLKIRERINDKQGIAYVLGNIGLIYEALKNDTMSLVYYGRSLKMKQEIGDKKGTSITYSNIGEIYKTKENYAKALEYYQYALAIAIEVDYKKVIASSLNNIGDVYKMQKNYAKASEYYTRTSKIYQDMGDKQGISLSYNNVGDIYRMTGDNENALLYFNKSLAIAEDIGDLELIRDNYLKTALTYESIKDYAKAYKYHQLFVGINDSIYNVESIQMIADMKTKYETEAKENEITLLKKESEVQDLKYSRGKILVFSIIGVLLLFVLFGLLTFRAYRFNKKAKLALQVTNKEIMHQKEQITRSSKELQKEKEKSDNLLLNILPYETAEELKSKGYASVRHYRNVSVLFTDFVGFTRITENLTPVELIGDLNMFFMRFDEIIEKYNLEKIKTIGDSYMCAGGLPHQDKDNPKKIVLAALEIQRFVKECNERKLKNNEQLWEMRIGVNTGDIIAGVVGKKKFAYDIWGDTVNTASRMESSGEPGKINISGNTYEHVKEFFDCTYRGKVSAKNKEDIDMYFVNGIKKNKMIFQEGNQPFQ